MSYLDLDTATGRATRKRRYNLLDGIDSQASSSKPTVRSDGSALQTGDRWLDTNDRRWFYWSGTYWLSEQLFIAATTWSSFGSGANFLGHFGATTDYNVFLEKFQVRGSLGATNSGTAFWTFQLLRANASSTTSEVSINTSALSTSLQFLLSSSLNIHRDVSALSLTGFIVSGTATGAPTATGTLSFQTFYRLAKP